MRRSARANPRTVVVLSVLAYFLPIPWLKESGNGYFTILSLLPVVAVGLLNGRWRGLQAAAIFTPVNYLLVWLLEGSLESMTAPGGLMGTMSLFAVGWLVGYLHDLSEYRLAQVIEEKDRLIGTISHELRTPLSTILGLSHELSERVAAFTEEEIAEFCTLIAQQSSELEALISDLLVAARADIERIKVARVPVDLGAAADAAIAVASAAWEKQPALKADPIPILAAADGLRVRQILRNMLQNAGRYGGSRVWVTVRRVGEWTVVTVTDDGGGIEPGQVDIAFEPHVRAHKANGNTESLGLGLYVSRTLAELMDGSLEYRREDGLTHFDLALPVFSE